MSMKRAVLVMLARQSDRRQKKSRSPTRQLLLPWLAFDRLSVRQADRRNAARASSGLRGHEQRNVALNRIALVGIGVLHAAKKHHQSIWGSGILCAFVLDGHDAGGDEI